MISDTLYEPTPSYVDRIYQAAKEKNETALTELLQYTDIGVVGENKNLPIVILAYENDKDSVQFLIQFNASLNHAAYGYACGGHKQEAYELLKVIKPNCRAQRMSMLGSIAYGFALKGHLKLSNKRPNQANSLWDYLAFFSIQEDNFFEDCTLFNLVLLDYPDQKLSILNNIMKGFSHGGYKEETFQLLKDIPLKSYPC